jgi:dimethylglycine dehydrogenase
MQRNNWHANPQSIIKPNEIAQLCPILNMDGILGGLYNPEDGHVDPYSLTHALAVGAKKYGATIQTNCSVIGLKQTETGDWQVNTNLGALKTKHVVNAAGFWAHEIGQMVGIELPLIPIHHQYLVTNPVQDVVELQTEIPVLRDLEGSYYLRQERDGLLVGPYESADKMRLQEEWVKSGVPPGFGKELFDSDLDRISEHLGMAAERVPCFANAGISQVICGPIMYSPDSLPLVGPWQGLPNFWLSCGFGYGIIHAGGAGRYLANWIINGEPPYQLIEADPVRFGKWTTRTFTAVKARESYGMNTAFAYPKEERPVGRPARVSGAYEAMKQRGAEFGFHAGWEQPNWFALPGDKEGYMPSFQRTNWFKPVHRESELIRKRVGVIDLSPFGKLEVKGRDSANFIDFMFANNVPKVGRTNISHMVTPSGRTCSEMTVSHLSDNEFFLVTGSGSERHDQRWLEQHLPSRGDVAIVNVTDDYGCLGVAGPFSRNVMASLTSTPMGNKEFPFLSFQNIMLRDIPVLAIRVSYTGELGWELHHKSQYTHDLYKAILDAGEPFGIGDFGTYAMTSLRLEKGFRAWGAEMSMDSTPLEAKLDPFIKLKKTAEFIGKDALLKQKAHGLTQELVFLTVNDNRDIDPEGNEAIWFNNKVVGYTTSGGFGYEVQRRIAFGYVSCELARPGTQVQVELFGELRDAEVVPCPMVEPEHMRNRKC